MIKTSVIDPISHSNQRSELRLESGRVYKGSLRLGNLGCTITNPANTSYLYNTASGVLSLIQNIYLYDGTQLLEQLLDAHHMFAFRNLKNSLNAKNKNAYNFNINQQLIGLTNSYDIEADPRDLESRPKRVEMIDNAIHTVADDDPDTTFKGWVDLLTHFNFLKNMVYSQDGQQLQLLDTNVFKNFRIIIEWRSAAELVSCFQGTTTALRANILPPELYCDELVGLSLPKNLSFQYDVYELDKLVCVGRANAGDVFTKSRLNGFNGKYLKRLLMANIEPASLTNADAGAVDGIKCDGSKWFNGEILQLYVNGESLFDFNGIDSAARKACILGDSWGTLNLPLLSYNVVPNPVFVSNLDKIVTKTVFNLMGRMNFGGCLVQQRISEFVVEHKRIVAAAADPFLMYLFGEIAKQISMDGNGSYTISYV